MYISVWLFSLMILVMVNLILCIVCDVKEEYKPEYKRKVYLIVHRFTYWLFAITILVFVIAYVYLKYYINKLKRA